MEKSDLRNDFIKKVKKERTLPTIDEAGTIAVKMTENIKAKEQSFFIAGFQECIKYLEYQSNEC